MQKMSKNCGVKYLMVYQYIKKNFPRKMSGCPRWVEN